MKRSRVPSTQWRERPATTKPCARRLACDWQRLAVRAGFMWIQWMPGPLPGIDSFGLPRIRVGRKCQKMESSVAQPRTLHQASIVEGRCRVERGQDVLLNRKESVCHVHPLSSTPRIPRLGLLSAAASLQIFQASASDRLHAGGFLFLQGSSLELGVGSWESVLVGIKLLYGPCAFPGCQVIPKTAQRPHGPRWRAPPMHRVRSTTAPVATGTAPGPEPSATLP
jgi:hypothetical protein